MFDFFCLTNKKTPETGAPGVGRMTWPNWPVGMGERPETLHPGKGPSRNHKLFDLTLNGHLFEFALIFKV